MTDSAPASANHTYQATLTSQDSSGTNSARPNTSPQQNEPRRLRPASATTSSAGPSAASGQTSNGGKDGEQGQAARDRDEQRPARAQTAEIGAARPRADDGYGLGGVPRSLAGRHPDPGRGGPCRLAHGGVILPQRRLAVR